MFSKNEFVENDELNTAIHGIYLAMYKHTDKGVKNGEMETTIDCSDQPTPNYASWLSDGIQEYFNALYHNANMKKYYIAILIEDKTLKIDFKWGHHAIVANSNMMAKNQV